MIRALYVGGLGMTSQMKRMDVVANNIANADTTGFKRDGAVTRTFTEEYLRRINDTTDRKLEHNGRIGKYGQGLFVDQVFTDFSNGSFRVTGGIYNLALAGEGFFSVNDKNGQERLTRDGAFTVDATGKLMTKDGFPVLSAENAEIIIPADVVTVTIDERGAIRADGETIANLKLTNVTNPDTLRKVGDNLYRTTEDTQTAAFAGRVEQGMLENSNVNAVKEMVDVINVSRIYELNQKVVQTADTVMGHIATDIGRKA